jgi:hypothetical protein
MICGFVAAYNQIKYEDKCGPAPEEVQKEIMVDALIFPYTMFYEMVYYWDEKPELICK